MKFTKSLKTALIAILVTSISVFSPAQATTPKASASAAARSFLRYQVTITGSAGGRAFTRTGTLTVTSTITNVGTTNGVNPLDVVLTSGTPVTSPQTGAIQYATNTYLLGGSAQLDMSYVSYNQSTRTISIQPDGRLAATGLNCFNVANGLTASLYLVNSGQMNVTLSSNGQRVTGTINFVGYAFGPGLPYQATISGQLVQQGTF